MLLSHFFFFFFLGDHKKSMTLTGLCAQCARMQGVARARPEAVGPSVFAGKQRRREHNSELSSDGTVTGRTGWVGRVCRPGRSRAQIERPRGFVKVRVCRGD